MQTEQVDLGFGKRQLSRQHLNASQGMKIGHQNPGQYVPNRPKQKSSLAQYIGGANSESSDFILNRKLSPAERETPPKTVFHKKMSRNSTSTLDGVLKFNNKLKPIPVNLDKISKHKVQDMSNLGSEREQANAEKKYALIHGHTERLKLNSTTQNTPTKSHRIEQEFEKIQQPRMTATTKNSPSKQ